MKNKNSEVCYKYKDGRFLKTSYMGDGEYELILTKKLTGDCIFPNPKDWSLSQIIDCCDGIYDDLGDHIADRLDISEFVTNDAEVKLK